MDNRITIEPLDNIRQEKRIQIIADLLISGHSKRQIVDQLTNEWKCSRRTVETLIKETLVYLHEENQIDREQLRTLNLCRLDDIFGDAQTVKEKLATIDMINKTSQLYDNTLNVKMDDTITIDLGV